MRKRLLLTNDDGYAASGIRRLYAQLIAEYEVTVIAPQTEQSGIGHAFSYKSPLSYMPIPAEMNMNGYAVAGTPSDCVKFAIAHLLKSKPDCIVSGMNIGENTGVSSHYSGTVAAAREGALWAIPSIAFSLSDEAAPHADAYAANAVVLLKKILQRDDRIFGMDGNNVCLNVNFPPCPPDACKGVAITRQSLAFFDDRYQKIIGGDESKQYWLSGKRTDIEQSLLYDTRAIEEGYIAVTPLECDATAHQSLPLLAGLDIR
jgi:5'-nucleotidase